MGMLLNRKSGAALVSGASLRAMMYVNAATPTIGISKENTDRGIPNRVNFAGETNGDIFSLPLNIYGLIFRSREISLHPAEGSVRQILEF